MRHLIPGTLVVLVLLTGCDRDSGSGIVAGGTTNLMDPFQGTWKCSQTKTIALWQAQKMPAADIAAVQKVATVMAIHPDLKIQGTTVVLPGMVEGEYAIFALHQHGTTTCGKAWHHEDRHDPGDMSKCYVRLEIRGSDLHFSIRETEDDVNVNDPELTNIPATAPATNCTADAATNPPWSPWHTYVFTR